MEVYYLLLYSGFICVWIYIIKSTEDQVIRVLISMYFLIPYFLAIQCRLNAGAPWPNNKEWTFQKHFQLACSRSLCSIEELGFDRTRNSTEPTIKRIQAYCRALLTSCLFSVKVGVRIVSCESDDEDHERHGVRQPNDVRTCTGTTRTNSINF